VAALRAASHDRRHESLVLLAQLESATADGGFELDRAIAGLARAVMATLDCRSSEAATAMEAVRRLCAEANIDADLISAMLRVVGDLVLVSETSRKTLRAEQLDLSSFSIVIDARSHELRIRDRIVSLRKRTVLRRLLYALTRRLGRPVSKDDLTEALWSRPYNPLVHDNPLKSNIRHARHILAAAHIEIEFDEPGYRLVAPTGFAFVEPFLL
jgi:DNA-binding response OmpR family regulator